MDKKILIVEDETALLYALEASLNVEGFKAITATEGNEGLKKAKSEKPDLIVLDILLPGINGFEILKTLKNTAETKKIPVVIISNLGEDAEVKRGKELGAEDFFVKASLSLDQITEKIKKHIK